MGDPQRFEVQSNVGSDIAQFRPGGERPPRSAKIVVSVDMGSGPGGGDYRTYLISSDQKRSGWTLWARGHDYDTGRPLYCRMAWGEPYKGYSASEAAKHLVEAVVKDEMLEGISVETMGVAAPGLLTSEDVQSILLAVLKK